MSVRFKFKNDLDYQAVPCDGFHISVKDLKRNIVRQKRLGRVTDFDLLVTNSQTNKVYTDETELISKNTTLTVQRAPLQDGKKKTWEEEPTGSGIIIPTSSSSSKPLNVSGAVKNELSKDGSEEDKINEMMSHSTEMYDQKHWTKYRGRNAFAPGSAVPAYWKCARCQQNHWITDCPHPHEIKKTTGIPRSFFVPSDKSVPGAKVNPQGLIVVRPDEKQAYSQTKVEKNTWMMDDEDVEVLPKVALPSDLLCPICKDLLRDAVMMPCCAGSACDECARDGIINSEGSKCPVCGDEASPEDVIPYRMYRNKVDEFKNKTGYVAKPPVQSDPTLDSTPTLPDITLPDIQAKFSHLLQPRVSDLQPDLNTTCNTPGDSTPMSSPAQTTSPSQYTTGTPHTPTSTRGTPRTPTSTPPHSDHDDPTPPGTPEHRQRSRERSRERSYSRSPERRSNNYNSGGERRTPTPTRSPMPYPSVDTSVPPPPPAYVLPPSHAPTALPPPHILAGALPTSAPQPLHYPPPGQHPGFRPPGPRQAVLEDPVAAFEAAMAKMDREKRDGGRLSGHRRTSPPRAYRDRRPSMSPPRSDRDRYYRDQYRRSPRRYPPPPPHHRSPPHHHRDPPPHHYPHRSPPRRQSPHHRGPRTPPMKASPPRERSRDDHRSHSRDRRSPKPRTPPPGASPERDVKDWRPESRRTPEIIAPPQEVNDHDRRDTRDTRDTYDKERRSYDDKDKTERYEKQDRDRQEKERFEKQPQRSERSQYDDRGEKDFSHGEQRDKQRYGGKEEFNKGRGRGKGHSRGSHRKRDNEEQRGGLKSRSQDDENRTPSLSPEPGADLEYDRIHRHPNQAWQDSQHSQPAGREGERQDARKNYEDRDYDARRGNDHDSKRTEEHGGSLHDRNKREDKGKMDDRGDREKYEARDTRSNDRRGDERRREDYGHNEYPESKDEGRGRHNDVANNFEEGRGVGDWKNHSHVLDVSKEIKDDISEEHVKSKDKKKKEKNKDKEGKKAKKKSKKKDKLSESESELDEREAKKKKKKAKKVKEKRVKGEDDDEFNLKAIQEMSPNNQEKLQKEPAQLVQYDDDEDKSVATDGESQERSLKDSREMEKSNSRDDGYVESKSRDDRYGHEGSRDSSPSPIREQLEFSTEMGIEKVVQKEKSEVELPTPALSKWEKEEDLPSDSVFDTSVDDAPEPLKELSTQHSLEVIAKNEPESSYMRELVSVHGAIHGVEPSSKDDLENGNVNHEFHTENGKPEAGPVNVLRKALGEIIETDQRQSSDKADPENCVNQDDSIKKQKKKKKKKDKELKNGDQSSGEESTDKKKHKKKAKKKKNTESDKDIEKKLEKVLKKYKKIEAVAKEKKKLEKLQEKLLKKKNKKKKHQDSDRSRSSSANADEREHKTKKKRKSGDLCKSENGKDLDQKPARDNRERDGSLEKRVSHDRKGRDRTREKDSNDREVSKGKRKGSSRDRDEGKGKRRDLSREGDEAEGRGKRRDSSRGRDEGKGKKRVESGGIQGGIQVRIGMSGERSVNDETNNRNIQARLGEGERSVKDRLGDVGLKSRLGNVDNFKRMRQDSLDSPPRKSIKERLGVIPGIEKSDTAKDGRGSLASKLKKKSRSRSRSRQTEKERLEDLQRTLLKPMPEHLQNWTKNVNSTPVERRDSHSVSLSPDPHDGDKKKRKRSGSSDKKKRRKSSDHSETHKSSKKNGSRKGRKKSKDKNNKEDRKNVGPDNSVGSPKRDTTPPRRRKNQRLTNEREYEESDE